MARTSMALRSPLLMKAGLFCHPHTQLKQRCHQLLTKNLVLCKLCQGRAAHIVRVRILPPATAWKASCRLGCKDCTSHLA